MTLFEMRKSQLHAHFCQCPEIRIILSTYSLNWFYSQEQEQELLPPGSAFFFLGCRGPSVTALMETTQQGRTSLPVGHCCSGSSGLIWEELSQGRGKRKRREHPMQVEFMKMHVRGWLLRASGIWAALPLLGFSVSSSFFCPSFILLMTALPFSTSQITFLALFGGTTYARTQTTPGWNVDIPPKSTAVQDTRSMVIHELPDGEGLWLKKNEQRKTQKVELFIF